MEVVSFSQYHFRLSVHYEVKVLCTIVNTCFFFFLMKSKETDTDLSLTSNVQQIQMTQLNLTAFWGISKVQTSIMIMVCSLATPIKAHAQF